MIGASAVATPSVSNSRDPFLPGVLGRSIRVSPSEKIRLPILPSRKDIFCWIAEAFRALMSGVTTLDETVFSSTILYLPLFRFCGLICLTALSNAFPLTEEKSISADLWLVCHQ